jgi:hypothetical protein
MREEKRNERRRREERNTYLALHPTDPTRSWWSRAQLAVFTSPEASEKQSWDHLPE